MMDLSDAIRAAGWNPPQNIITGKTTRFATGDRGRDSNGWVYPFPDGLGAAFGCWRSGEVHTWQLKRDKPLSPVELTELKFKAEQARKAAEIEREQRHQQAATEAAQIVANAQPAPADHDYLARKHIQPNGALVDTQNRLIVKIYDQSGNVANIQRISADGTKRFLSGGKIQGNFAIVGDYSTSKPLLIAEGFATAASLYQHTGFCCIAALSASNLKAVAEYWRTQRPSEPIILMGDNDSHNKGQESARLAALAVSGGLMIPPSEGDWNDHLNTGGAIDIPTTPAPVPAGGDTQFKLVRVSDLTAQPKPVDWLLDGFLESGSLNLLFGAPASGKSLFAFDWAFCIASGRDWLGHETQKRDVVILAGEGHSGLRRRMRALEVKYGEKTTDNLLVSEIPANLTDQTAMVWVADAIKQNCAAGGLVIVDTLNRNIGAADENNAKDIAILLSLIDGYIRSMGIAVLIVHHSGHLDKDRARGSSAIKAAVDAEFCVIKTPESIVLKCTKAKDFEPPKPMQFNLTVTELGDAWREKSGESITSVFLEYSGEQTAGDTKVSKLNKRDEQILHELYNAIDKHGIPATAEIKAKFAGFDTLTSLVGEKKVVYVDYWEELVLPLLDAPKAESNKSTFRRSRKSLFERGKVANFNNYWWPV